MDASARLTFNTKVLKRHDPLIVDIVESASFVVLYEHSDQQWEKTGIEGPLFLYKRSAPPTYGFFVLNRNGIDNFSAHLVEEGDLELTDTFIIYCDTSSQVVGLWVYEAAQLAKLGQQMLELKNAGTGPSSNAAGIFASSLSQPSSPAHAGTSQAGQSISLDALFGTANAQTSASSPDSAKPNGKSLLDSLFKNAAASDMPRPPSASQLPTPLIADDSYAQALAPAPVGGVGAGGEDDLKSLLGLGPPPAPKTAAAPTQPSAVPGLEALFASARLSPAAQTPPPARSANVAHRAPPSNAVAVNPAAPTSNASAAATAADIDESLRARVQQNQPALSRADFVREILSLIHTDASFIDDVYGRYLARVS